MQALGLVILVVFIFLQSWRATLIPLLAIPVALIGTFAFFPLLGFSINVLSLLGLVLSIGMPGGRRDRHRRGGDGPHREWACRRKRRDGARP